MLPTLPMNTNKCAKNYKRQQEIVAFRGLNRTQNTQEGEFSFAQNLSTANFPTLTQRGKRTEIAGYSNPTDIFAWDGHLVVVDGGILYFDGQPIDNVSPGKKQFAVVNTKLIVWPDKTYIDLSSLSSEGSGPSVQTSGDINSITITPNTFKVNESAKTQADVGSSGKTYYYGSNEPYLYTYGTSAAAVAACWQSGAWNMTSLSSLQTSKKTAGAGAVSLPAIEIGDIFIPSQTNIAFDWVLGAYNDAAPDTSKYNSSGFYAIITRNDGIVSVGECVARIGFDVYHITSDIPVFTGTFSVGDAISFLNMPNGLNVRYAVISGIDDTTHTLTFDNPPFSVTGTYSNAVTIQMTEGISYGHLDASMETSGQASSITIADGNKFTASLTAKIAAGLSYQGESAYGTTYTYTYGTDTASFMQCWHDDAWDMSMLTQRQSKVTFSTGGISVGSIFIPAKNGNAYSVVTGGPYQPTDPDRSRYNQEGYYGIVTGKETNEYWVDNVHVWVCKITFDVYNATQIVKKFSSAFKVGDSVTISGTKNGTADVSHAIIRAITDNTNTLTFDANTFNVPGGYDTSTYVVTIQREVPNLDYICEKDNRLWGVSNNTENTVYNADTQRYETFKSRAIYASALGDPTNWWTFDGIDSDSYQVAVGSEGDFTGICAFNNAVCCWKEDRLYKVLGNYPSEYYIHDSIIEGVGNGSYRSMTIVNEVLYYNGATGIYAYTGSTPSLIGYPLGTLYTNANGGTNGLRYYLSGTKPDGTQEMVVYDLTHRIWTREDGIDASAFATIGNNLYLIANRHVYLTEQGDDPNIEWVAEFVAFNETALIRKYYLRLLLRLEMETGSSVTVKVKHDNGDFITLLNADATAALVKSVEIPPKRCDKLTVRLEGTGNVLLRHMTREYTVGSERP